MAAWQSHAACEFLSGLTLRSQADVSREQQLSAGARELDDGGSALDPAAAPGALSLDDAQSPSVAGEGGGAGLLSKEGAKLVLGGASFSKLRHGGGALPPPHDPVGSRVLLAPRAGHRPCISFSVLRFHKEVLPPLSWVVLPPLSWVVLPPLAGWCHSACAWTRHSALLRSAPHPSLHTLRTPLFTSLPTPLRRTPRRPAARAPTRS
jgi:hypothetical protein